MLLEAIKERGTANTLADTGDVLLKIIRNVMRARFGSYKASVF
ncbi:hypothetical protein VHA_001077 [Grimontia hollisae CIP 101886]|uniref:Uncharacterized protein n=1 Tax=Grimontia hollisae CIP 101886 TaxID=675812 RepID=D0I5R0_GRIHO|nr:hypothetical protein VHA_001077 [Grimontia hollisae CIP 101886]